jgi:hypothetical protein
MVRPSSMAPTMDGNSSSMSTMSAASRATSVGWFGLVWFGLVLLIEVVWGVV